jgi:elongation factor Ts
VEITTELVKELRAKTGAGVLDCKNVLVETKGNMEEAIKILRERGIAKAEKKATRAAKEGLIFTYIHPPGKLGVMLEMNCETDFVARNQEFQTLCKDVAMHIAASAPSYVTRSEIPQTILDKEKEIYANMARNEGKPEKIIDKIVEGRVEKFYKDVCCLEQQFVKDPNITVDELIKQLGGKMGENILLRRFTRYIVGEE